MIRTWAARSGVLLAALAVMIPFGSGAFAQGGHSTPGVAVTAQNPGTHPGDSLRITLTAHTEKGTVENPDCRPQSATLQCRGSLVLRIPGAGVMSVSGFQVHRVAVPRPSGRPGQPVRERVSQAAALQHRHADRPAGADPRRGQP